MMKRGLIVFLRAAFTHLARRFAGFARATPG